MIRRFSWVFNVVLGMLLTLAALPGPIQADLVDGASVVTKAVLPPNVISGQNYKVQMQDCFRPAVVMQGGQFTLTLPPATSVFDGCTINVKNADNYLTGGRGKKLSGFPADWISILWPLQGGSVASVGGNWISLNDPGRWEVPSQVTFHVDLGGSNGNDCLASGTTNACQTAQGAYTHSQYHLDNQGTTPIIAMACSQTHTVALVMGGTPFGTNLTQISPDGNCSFNWFISGSTAPITIGDLAQLDLNLTFYGSSGAMQCTGNTTNTAFSAGCIFMHGPGVVLDLEGTPVWFPGGGNDNGIFCDGICQATIANGITQGAGSGNYVIHMSAGGKITASGTISGSSGSSATGVYRVFGNAMLIMTTANAAAGTWTGGIGNSTVEASSVFVNNGLTPAGGISVGASSVNCTALTAAC